MITVDDIWNALDEIAATQNVSRSRMAIISGLDATTFNKSKRCDVFGKQRMPALRTILQVLNQYKMTMADFGVLCDKMQHERTAAQLKQASHSEQMDA